MPTVVRIRQHQFTLNRTYQAGHILTDGEAAALNQILAENVRNNVYPWVVAATRDGFLSVEEHKDLEDRINEYTDKYEFKIRIRNRPATPIEVTARELASQEAEIWGQQQGLQPDSPEVNRKFHELTRDRDLLERARKLVKSRQSVMDNALEGLI